MAEVKKRCQVDGCGRASSTLCHCCNKNVCTRHFNEHINAIKTQIDPLVDDVNTMAEKIQDLTIEQVSKKPFEELKQWQIDMHQLVDDTFSAKSKEIEYLIEKYKEEFIEHKQQQLERLTKIRNAVKQLVEDDDATSEQLHILKNQLADVETIFNSIREKLIVIDTRVKAPGSVKVSSNFDETSSQQMTLSDDDLPKSTNTSLPRTSPSSIPQVSNASVFTDFFRFNSTTVSVNSTTTASAFSFARPTSSTSTTAAAGLSFARPTSSTSTTTASGFSFARPTPSTTTTAASAFSFATPISFTATTAAFGFPFGTSNLGTTTTAAFDFSSNTTKSSSATSPFGTWPPI